MPFKARNYLERITLNLQYLNNPTIQSITQQSSNPFHPTAAASSYVRTSCSFLQLQPDATAAAVAQLLNASAHSWTFCKTGEHRTAGNDSRALTKAISNMRIEITNIQGKSNEAIPLRRKNMLQNQPIQIRRHHRDDPSG